MLLESPSRIEPCALDRFPAHLADLVSEIAKISSSLGEQLHVQTALGWPISCA